MTKSILSSALIGLLAISGVAICDSFPVNVANEKGATNSVSFAKATGHLSAIVVDITGVSTQTITVTSAKTGEAILTATVSADAVFRPRVTVDTVAGVEVGLGTNDLEMFYLSDDTLTYKITETAAVTNSTRILTITE